MEGPPGILELAQQFSQEDPPGAEPEHPNTSECHCLTAGFGPAGMGPLLLACKKGLLSKLLDLGCVWVEKGPQLGSGALGQYVVNANTSASVFVAHFRKNPTFSQMLNSRCFRDLDGFGNDPAPLQLVGKVLQEAAGCLAELVRGHSTKGGGRSELLEGCEVKSVQLRSDSRLDVKVCTGGLERTLTSRWVLLALGGVQREIELSPAQRAKAISGVSLLSEQGVAAVRARLATPGSRRVVVLGGSHSAFSAAWTLLNRVVPSKESIARKRRLRTHLRLLRPDAEREGFETVVQAVMAEVEERHSRLPKWKRGNLLSGETFRSIEKHATRSLAIPRTPAHRPRPPAIVCSALPAICTSLSPQRTLPSGLTSPLPLCVRNSPGRPGTVGSPIAHKDLYSPGQSPGAPEPGGASETPAGDWGFEAGSITLLHRSRVKLFYRSKAAAKADKYSFDKAEVSYSGRVNAFGGIRWDSKELYQEVLAGRETRLKLMHATVDSVAGQAALEEADLIVVCSGFRANSVPVLDRDGQPVPLRRDQGGQLRLSKAGLVCSESTGEELPGLMAVGLGCGQLASVGTLDGERGAGGVTEVHADGVDLYMSHYAARVLDNVFPQEKRWGSLSDPKLSSSPSKLSSSPSKLSSSPSKLSSSPSKLSSSPAKKKKK